MQTIYKLSQACEDALQYISKLPEVLEAEIVASSNALNIIRLNYTSHIVCNGGEEVKSTENFGIGIRAVFKTDKGIKVGFGSEANNLSVEGAVIALEKARKGAVEDKEFSSLPKSIEEKRTLYNYHDPLMMEMKDENFIDAGWKIMDGAIEEFRKSETLKELARKYIVNWVHADEDDVLKTLGLIVGGDLSIITERYAIASTSMPEVKTDESTIGTARVTAMVEKFNAKGFGYGLYTKISQINEEAGREAARNAIQACGIKTEAGFEEPQGLESGNYTLIFGPQPVADFLNNLILPSLSAGTFYGMESPFLGKMGQQIASPLINIYDDAANPELAGAKGITCEGLPTKRTDLIKEGIFNDILSDWYETQRLLNRDPEAEKKLGRKPQELYCEGKLRPTSGFRFSTGGGRAYDSTPGVSGTNVVMEGVVQEKIEELIKKVVNGVYVGAIWYTYPINGLSAGDFTATIIADSYIIKDGKIVAPLKANAVRINDNFLKILLNIKGVSDAKKSALPWATDEIPVACEILVSDVRLEEIKPQDAAPTGM